MTNKFLTTDVKFDIGNVKILPAEIVNSKSRQEYNPYNKDGQLPIIISPMYSSFTLENNHFNHNFDLQLSELKIPFCYTRNYKVNDGNKLKLLDNNSLYFKSYSLEEFNEIFANTTTYNINYYKNNPVNVLIDTANGHLKHLIDSVKRVKDVFGESVTIMAGNIANPKTYKLYAEAGVDYARMSVGSGSVCTTSKNTSVFFPMGSLIHETKQIKEEYGFTTKIVADGGFSNYSDIITGLALGADYIMIGGIPSKFLDSDSTPYLFKKIPINNKYISEILYDFNLPLYKRHIGMSTQFIQKKWGNKKLKTNEGIITFNKVNNNLSNWTVELVHFLRNILSYTDCKNIEELQDNANLIFVTDIVSNKLKL